MADHPTCAPAARSSTAGTLSRPRRPPPCHWRSTWSRATSGGAVAQKRNAACRA